MRQVLGVTALLIVLSVLNTASSAARQSGGNGFSFMFGTEYQSISQKYYDAIIDTTSIDDLEQWVLAKDNIEELTGKTTIQYQFQDSKKRFKIYNDMELSKEKWIGRGDLSLHVGDFSEFIKMNAKAEHKSSLTDDEDSEQGYTTISGYLQVRKKYGEKMSLGARIYGESIFFADPAQAATSDLLNNTRLYNEYDYSLVSGRLEGQFLFGEFGKSLDWELGGKKRLVPDSLTAEYNQFYSRLSYNGFGESGYIMFEAGGEYKDYAQPGNTDDYFLLNLDSRISHNISPDFELRLSTHIDYYSFREPDVINRDNARFRFDITGQRRLGSWNAGPVVEVEIYSEQAGDDEDEILFSDDYTQWELGARADVLSGSRLFADLEATFGHRGYSGDEAVISSYNLISLSTMASITFYRQMSVLFYFDGVFEYHDVKEDNSSLYLLSVSVTTRF